MYCPNCSYRLDANAPNCPNCRAIFGGGSGWKPTEEPSGPVPAPIEARQASPSKPTKRRTGPPLPPQPYVPGLLGWANISLALAFSLPGLATLVGALLKGVVSVPVLQTLPRYQGHIVFILAAYVVAPVVIYLLLRAAHAESWLQPTRPMQGMIAFGNALYVVFLISRVLASTVQGGGMSFVVMTFAPVVIYPARVFHILGLGWLMVRSVQLRGSPQPRQTLAASEAGLVLVALAVPAAFVAILYIAPGSPLRKAHEAVALMEARCPSAGQKILRHPQAPVTGLYVDADWGQYYGGIKDGVYENYGGSIFAHGLLEGGFIRIMEKDNRQSLAESMDFKYRRYVLGDLKGKPVKELESEYGLVHKDLTTDAEKAAGLLGYEVSIRELETGEVVATTTYFDDPSHRRFCGHVSTGSFNLEQFVHSALQLKRQYPSRRPDPPVTRGK